MNEKLENKLFESFPNLYGKDKETRKELLPYGIQCDDGWFNLIFELSEKISKIDPNCKAVQVKEKFGGLRFYINETTSLGYKLIEEYENKSFHICEVCGNTETAKERSGNWVQTLCNDCEKTKDQRRAQFINNRLNFRK